MNKKIKYSIIISFTLFIAGILFISANKIKLSHAIVTDNQGITRVINFPFSAQADSFGNYVFEINFRNSFLFSGEIQIIPNDCLLKIWINGDTIPAFHYSGGKCDFSNGIYLDLLKYLRNDNTLRIEVSNMAGAYGLHVRDTTRYEKYMVLWFILCSLPLVILYFREKINLKQIGASIKRHKNFIILLISLSGLFLTVIHSLLLFNSRVEFSNPDGTGAPVTLPFYIDQKDTTTFTFKITAHNYCFFPAPIKIVSPGNIMSLIINGEDATPLLKQYNLYQWHGNISETLKQFLKTGRNEVLMTVNNTVGSAQGDFLLIKNNWNIFIYSFFVTLFLFPLLYRICKRFTYGKFIVSMLSASLLIWMTYACTLPFNNYSHDINGHIQYINYVYETGHIPISSGGWSFYHPPLYYIGSACAWHLANIFGIHSELELRELLQIVSISLFALYAFFSVKTLNFIFNIRSNSSIIPKQKTVHATVYLIIISLFLFWPSNVIHSIRIGNDILLYAFYSIAFYFILKWYMLKDYKNLVLSLIFTSIATWSKTNGLLLFVVISILLTIHYWYDSQRIQNRNQYVLKLLLIGCFSIVSIYFAFNERFHSLGRNNAEIIVGNENKIPQTLRVENKLINFIALNPKLFVNEPYTNSLDDAKGRQHFWHYLFKTSLFGEFSYDRPITKKYATILSLLFLFLLPIIIAGFIRSVINFKQDAPMVISIILLLGSVIFLRIITPYSSANDFRFIFPAITLFSYFIGVISLYLLNRSRVLFFTIISIPCFFVIFSILFQVSFIM